MKRRSFFIGRRRGRWADSLRIVRGLTALVLACSGCSLTQRSAAVEQPYQQGIIEKSVRAADYAILDSHFFGLATRPFSYTFRMLTLSRDTVYETATLPIPVLYPDMKKIPPLSRRAPMDRSSFEQYLDRLTGRPVSRGTARFLIDGDAFFPRMIEAITNASVGIDIRLFIFDNDDYAVRIADLLKVKSAQGVRVRVLLDSMGQILGEGKMPEDLPVGFVPPRSIVPYLQQDSGVEVRRRPSAFFRGDHTKTIMIDNRVGFTGGMNIGREYRRDWHDMMIELSGPILDEIRYEFNLAWEHAGMWGDLAYFFARMTHRRPVPGTAATGVPMRLLYTRVNDPEIFRAQLEAIRRARSYIWIHNAYFSNNDIINELVAARRRGVDVRVILPGRTNHKIMTKSNIVTANILFRNGIKVYFYPGMAHVKAAIYDGWICAGSANFDKLSLLDNLEMNIASFDDQVAGQLKDSLFERDFQRCTLMTEPLDSNILDVIAEIVAEQL